MKKKSLFLLPVISGLLLSLSFPSYDLGFLAWTALAPFLFALRLRGWYEATGCGILFGCSFGLGAFLWFNDIADVIIICTLLMLVLFCSYFIIFSLLYRLISRSAGNWMIIAGPALWVTIEYMRLNFFFLNNPWNLLGHSQYQYPVFIQIADMTGVHGVSFVIFMVNQFISQVPDLFTGRRSKEKTYVPCSFNMNWKFQVIILIGVLSATLLYGQRQIDRYEHMENTGSIRVATVQANVLTKNGMSETEQAEHMQAYERLTMTISGRDPDLIVWGGTSLPASINSSKLVRASLRKIVRDTNAYLLAGGAGYDKLSMKGGEMPGFSNSEYLINPLGRLAGQYNKMRLLPFDEFIPLEKIIKWPRWITNLPLSFTPGREYKIFNVSDARFGTPICWENFFGDHFRHFVLNGANFMVSPTNEGFFGRNSAPYQSLAVNIFRAVENKTALVRVTTTGVSAFIGPDGEIIDRIKDDRGDDLFVSGVLVRDVPLFDKKTVFTVYGDIFAYIAIGISLLFIAYSFYSRKKDII